MKPLRGPFSFSGASQMKKRTDPGALATGVTDGETPVAAAAHLSPISPAQLAVNRANAHFSTGPRSEAGRARAVAGPSRGTAVKSALTGRTVLLPTDDRDEYARFLADFQQQLKPVGQVECELVQIIVDCHWRLRRIQDLEFALYGHGHEQFESVFQDYPESERRSRILLQTHLTYEKRRNGFVFSNEENTPETRHTPSQFVMAETEPQPEGADAGLFPNHSKLTASPALPVETAF
jgi:hypothetical protein